MKPGTRRRRCWSAVALMVWPVLGALGCQGGSGALEPAELPDMRLIVEGQQLRDALGRQVLLRGVNAGGRSKMSPFVPFAFRESGLAEHAGAPSFEEALGAYFDRIAGFGHNVVRLPFSWEGLEPVQGQRDGTYLERYLAMVDAAEARGIRVIVEFHQDAFASPFCGDGFPLWTLLQPPPEPPESCAGWYLAYLDDPVLEAAYDRFWNDQDGIRTDFEEMWRSLSAEAWGHPAVVAFEVMNEPSPGSADEETWAPTVLRDFYSRMAAIIQGAAPGAPVIFDVAGVSSATGETSLTRPNGEKLVFGPHYYDPGVFMLDTWSSADLSLPLGRWQSLADAWGVPAFLGEFGARTRCQGGAEYLRAMYTALDDLRMHATVWEVSQDPVDWNEEGFSLVDAAGVESPLAAEVVRAYPAAVAGSLLRFAYDARRRRGEFEYEAEAGGLTEIAAPARLYPDGLVVELTGPAARWAYHPSSGRLLIQADGAGTLAASFGPP